MKNAIVLVALLVIVVPAGVVLADIVFQKTEVRTHTFKGPIREIIVFSDGGDVTLVRGRGRGVRLRETRRHLFSTPTLERDLHDGVLTLDATCEARFVSCQDDLRLTVPAGIAVVAKSDSGDVVARGIDVARARLDSDSGAVRAGLRGHQQLVQAHTDSGDVDVRAGDARAVDAQTDSGDVVVAAAGAPRRIVAITDSGDVRVVAPAGAYRVDAQSDSGDVKLKRISRNDRAGRSIEAHTDSGDVTLEGG